ncbi:MAG: N-6 DNA methylase, partial [Promethearchaeota archaeon]
MVENKKIINSDFIKKNFGIRSEIFKESITYFKEIHKLNEKVFHDEFKKWKQQYINIYRNNLNIDIFYRYLYYIIILHSIIENKIKKVKTRINAIDLKYILRYLIPQIDFLNEHEILGKIGNKIFKKLNGGSFASEDLFQEIYQEIFFMELRHEKGEFYTFPNLVKRMVESEYTFGMKTLDPSCGSGSFLVEIIMKILASSNNFDEKKEAISNIVGFDINPTAIITAKINIFLLLVDFFDDFQEILKYIKIYLVDALFPEESLVGVDDIFRSLKGHFDLIIGNPPWLTYK